MNIIDSTTQWDQLKTPDMIKEDTSIIPFHACSFLTSVSNPCHSEHQSRSSSHVHEDDSDESDDEHDVDEALVSEWMVVRGREQWMKNNR